MGRLPNSLAQSDVLLWRFFSSNSQLILNTVNVRFDKNITQTGTLSYPLSFGSMAFMKLFELEVIEALKSGLPVRCFYCRNSPRV